METYLGVGGSGFLREECCKTEFILGNEPMDVVSNEVDDPTMRAVTMLCVRVVQRGDETGRQLGCVEFV